MISIITLTKNNYQQLQKTVHSLHDLDNFQHIIINGGSCPETFTLTNSIKCLSIHESDSGISDAFNKGISLATEKYVMLLNSGDELIDNLYIRYAIDYLESNSNIDFVHSSEFFSDLLVGQIKMDPLAKEKYWNIGAGMPFRHQTMVVRKRVYDSVGRFDLNFKICMDYEWVCRWLKTNGEAHYCSSNIPILMDGTGISVQKELRSFIESSKIIFYHYPSNLKIHFFLLLRWVKFLLRKILSLPPFLSVLKFSKILKYK
jgi:glycosyltransferase involved in cell wall biosynthesis